MGRLSQSGVHESARSCAKITCLPRSVKMGENKCVNFAKAVKVDSGSSRAARAIRHPQVLSRRLEIARPLPKSTPIFFCKLCCSCLMVVPRFAECPGRSRTPICENVVPHTNSALTNEFLHPPFHLLVDACSRLCVTNCTRLRTSSTEQD